MALTASDIIMYGPYTLVCKTVSASTKTLAGLKFDSLSFSMETNTGNSEFEDGTSAEWVEGRDLTIEATFSELVPADLDDLEGCDNLTIAFSESGKTITVASDVQFIASIDGGKSKIVMTKHGASDATIASLFTVS